MGLFSHSTNQVKIDNFMIYTSHVWCASGDNLQLNIMLSPSPPQLSLSEPTGLSEFFELPILVAYIRVWSVSWLFAVLSNHRLKWSVLKFHVGLLREVC